ncbi:MAG TPA: ferritin-like domain-containing protein [Puia sp.]|nr:ferritin-like domain-containing protein [Puia sp.]
MATTQKKRASHGTNSRTARNRNSNGKTGRDGSMGRKSNRSEAGAGHTSTQEGTDGENATHAGAVNHLEKYFFSQIADIYAAEQKIIESLPRMVEAASTAMLREAFEDHLYLTQRHKRRLEKVYQILGREPEQKTCQAIEGIVAEAEEIIRETQEGTMTRDAALIIAAQKVEHYEIASYGGLVELAITMQLEEVAFLLDKTLVEEEDTDLLLTEIAECEVNLGSEHESNEYSWAGLTM